MKIPSFADVTPEIWAGLKATIEKDDGAVMTGDEGVAELKGVKYSFKYEPSTRSLVIKEL